MLPDINKNTFEVKRTSLQDVWKQMENVKKLGLTKSIGVSNCPIMMFLEIMTFCEEKPAINQIECHPYLTLEDAQIFYNKIGVPLSTYGPLHPE